MTVLVYSNTFDVPFLFDDYTSIESKAQLYSQDVYALYKYFGSRFITYLTFKLNYQVNGFEVWGYHLVNLFIHLLTSACVYLLSIQLFTMNNILSKDRNKKNSKYIFALIVTLIFALHPLQTQAVTYIVQRGASIAALFYIATLLSYIHLRLSTKSVKQALFAFLTLLFMLLAFFSKQNTYTLPAALLLIEIVFIYQLNNRPYKHLIKPVVILSVISVFAVFYVLNAHPEFISKLDSLTRETNDFSRMQYLETQLGVVLLYVKLFFLPISQQVEYIYPLEDGNFFNSLGLIFVYFITISFAIWKVKTKPILSFAILFFFLTHLVESALIPISDLVFEHRSYLPNISLCLIVGCLLLSLFQNNKKSMLFILIITLSAISILTYQRNSIWADEEALYKNELKMSDKKTRIHGMLGNYYYEQKMHKKSAESFKKAFDNAGDFDDLDNLGYRDKFGYFTNYTAALGRIGKSKEAIEITLEILPKIKENQFLARILTNLGVFYWKDKNYLLCTKYMFKAMKIEPNMIEAIVGVGKCFAEMGDKEMAKHMFERALRVSPRARQIHKAIKETGI
ncbi:hypothetical protein AADZ91_01795 [Colwelliaceae bacterium 6441]